MVIGLIAGLAAGASALSGASGNRRARSAQRRGDRRARRAGDRWRDLVNQGAPRIEARLQEQRDYIEGGFDRAQGQVSGIADSSRRRVLEREGAASGAVTAGFKRQGLSGTNLGTQAQRAVRYDTERSLMDIDSQLAGLRSTIEQRRTGAVAGVIGEQARFERTRTQDLADVERSFMGFEGNRTYAAPGGVDLSGLASLASVFKE